MPCFRPMQAYRSKYICSTGKRQIAFNLNSNYFSDFEEIALPCGQCIGCRLERSRQWAIRCVHEASLHDSNCFITLTYDDDHLPINGSLDVRHFQLFMKRFRKRFGSGIRFFHCGEYGEQFGRPHYHACIFGFDFPDKQLWKVQNEVRLYTSDVLMELWPCGFSTVGDVTFDSAAYVARYIMKKVTGKSAVDHYSCIDFETGEVFDKKPEYTTMSRKPGIGSDWFKQFKSDVYPSDFIVMNGRKMRPPKFYDSRYELECPEEFVKIKEGRVLAAAIHAANNTDSRLIVRETVKSKQIDKLVRNLV